MVCPLCNKLDHRAEDCALFKQKSIATVPLPKDAAAFRSNRPAKPKSSHHKICPLFRNNAAWLLRVPALVMKTIWRGTATSPQGIQCLNGPSAQSWRSLEGQKSANTSPEGKYIYMEDLLALDTCHPFRPAPFHPARVSSILPPLPVEAWRVHLSTHPDRRFVDYTLQGLSEGFRVGFDHTHQTRPSDRNMKSAYVNCSVVSRYIAEELKHNRLLWFPVPQPWTEGVHLSPFGVILKKSSNKWRLIVDLSTPHGSSVNDGIDSALTATPPSMMWSKWFSHWVMAH